MAKDLLIEVIKIKGHCPVYAVGDSFRILEGFKLVAEKPLCMHSLAAIMPYYAALGRGVNPVDLGLAREGNVAFVQCLDPYECTGGGTVVFAISLEGSDGGEKHAGENRVQG